MVAQLHLQLHFLCMTALVFARSWHAVVHSACTIRRPALPMIGSAALTAQSTVIDRPIRAGVLQSIHPACDPLWPQTRAESAHAASCDAALWSIRRERMRIVRAGWWWHGSALWTRSVCLTGGQRVVVKRWPIDQIVTVQIIGPIVSASA